MVYVGILLFIFEWYFKSNGEENCWYLCMDLGSSIKYSIGDFVFYCYKFLKILILFENVFVEVVKLISC